MIQQLEYLNVPTKLTLIIIAFLVISNVVGEILEFKGKVVPEFIKIRKYFARRKQEKETMRKVPETLKEVQKTLNEVNAHYNTDSIKMRDKWIENVNHKLEKNDKWIKELDKKLDKNSDLILNLRIENMRAQILDFASTCMTHTYSREKYLEIIELIDSYETLLKDHGLKNGKVKVSHEIILESFKDRTEQASFLEDTVNKPYANRE